MGPGPTTNKLKPKPTNSISPPPAACRPKPSPKPRRVRAGVRGEDGPAAGAVLEQVVKGIDDVLRHGSTVVPVALNMILQLKVDGVAFRFRPDSREIMNVIKVLEKRGESTDGFSGMPMFQSRSLVLGSENKKYRPVFFRKEDLDRSLERASKDQGQLNPALRPGEISVCEFKKMMKDLKESSSSKWDDVVFIPPGFDVSTAVKQ